MIDSHRHTHTHTHTQTHTHTHTHTHTLDGCPAVNVKSDSLNSLLCSWDSGWSRPVLLLRSLASGARQVKHNELQLSQTRGGGGGYLLRPLSECLTSFLKHASSPSAGSAAASEHVSPNHSRLTRLRLALQGAVTRDWSELFTVGFSHFALVLFFFFLQLCFCSQTQFIMFHFSRELRQRGL